MLLENFLSEHFDFSLLNKLEAYNQQRDIAISEFLSVWENSEFEEEEAHLCLSARLSSLLADNNVIEIKATKNALNKVINWSSSKFNAYKKSEFIEIVLRQQARDTSRYTSSEYTAGSYGAGATGNARSNYGTKGTGGEYLLVEYGLNTYIFNGINVFSFTSNSEFIAKHSLSPKSIEFKNKLSTASEAFDNLWPIKDLNSEFNS